MNIPKLQPGYLLLVEDSYSYPLTMGDRFARINPGDILLLLEIENEDISQEFRWAQRCIFLHKGKYRKFFLRAVEAAIQNSEISIMQIPENHDTIES